MPDLLQSFLDRDVGFLQIVAAFWGVSSPVDDDLTGRSMFARSLLDAGLAVDLLAELPLPAAAALADLQQNDGRVLWSTFTRRHGNIRELGPGRRDREQPHLHPVSASEMLWYRGLLARAFFKKAGQLHEYAYIPSDLLDILPPPVRSAPGRSPAKLVSTSNDFLPVDRRDAILEDICSALAAARLGQSLANAHLPADPAAVNFITQLLQTSGMLSEDAQPVSENLKQHLEAPPAEAWGECFNSWERSTSPADLRSIPGIELNLEGIRPPQVVRQSILRLLRQQPADSWLELEPFIAGIQTADPDFFRSGGVFSPDQARSTVSHASIGEFTCWMDVEGAYIRYLLLGPLHWLGITAIGTSPHGGSPAAVRITPAGSALLAGHQPEAAAENAQILQKAGAVLVCPPHTPRRARYLLARTAEWLPDRALGYAYRITPASLAIARTQSLHVHHLVTLLRTYSTNPPSPAFTRALTRWEEQGPQAGIEPALLLQTSSPEILQQIMRSPAARHLVGQVGPTAAIIQAGAGDKLTAALLDLGYLADVKMGL